MWQFRDINFEVLDEGIDQFGGRIEKLTLRFRIYRMKRKLRVIDGITTAINRACKHKAVNKNRSRVSRYKVVRKHVVLWDLPLQVKTILFAPPAPKPEISMSGGFSKIDCQAGLSGENVEQIVAELRR